MIECSEQDRDDLIAVLSTSSGRRFMHKLVYEVCDIEGGTFYDKVHDGVCQSQHQNVREGHRDVGIELQQTFKSHPEVALLWCDAKTEAAAQCRVELSLVQSSSKPKSKRGSK